MLNSFKNLFFNCLVRFFKNRRQHKFNPKFPRILVVSTTALGDTLWATPLLRAIKKTYPKSFVSVLTSKIGYKVLEHNPYIDKLFLLKEPIVLHFFTLFKKLNRKKFQAVLYLHASQRPPLPLCALLNSQYLIGSSGHGKGLFHLFTHVVKTDKLHELKRRLKIGSVIGIEEESTKIDFFYKKPGRQLISKPYIVFHPGSKDPFRRWPAEYFIELGEKLSNHFKIAIIGTAKEKMLIEQIGSRIENAFCFCHISLSQLAFLLQQAALAVCNDSGPMHIAHTVGTPLVAFFIPTNRKTSGPLNPKNTILLEEKPPCSPCLKKNCLNPYCFYQIKPNKAYAACCELLKANNSQSDCLNLQEKKTANTIEAN